MKENEMRKALEEAVDRRLSGLQGEPYLAQRIINREREEAPVKVKTAIGIGHVLVALFLMATVAFAATEGYRSITINLEGEEIVENLPASEPIPTEAPEEARTDAVDVFLASVPEDQYGWAADADGGGATGRRRTVSSEEAFFAALEEADYLTRPVNIPEDYALQEAILLLGCREEGVYKLEESASKDGVAFARYSVDPQDDVIIGYELIYRRSAGEEQYIHISSTLSESAEDDAYEFGVSEEATYHALDISEMERAVYVEDEGFHTLIMLRALENTIPCLQVSDQSLERPKIIQYRAEQMDISATALSEAEIIAMVNR